MKPNIAYLTGEFPRATDTFIQREVAALRSDGFNVDTFAVRRPGSEHLTGEEQRRGQATTTYLLELAKSPALASAHLTMFARSPGAYLRGLRLARQTKRAGVRGSIFQLIYFVEAVILAHQIRSRGIEHLHNHFGDSSCTVAMLAAEVAEVPYSFTLHGSAIFFEAKTWRLDEKLDRASFCACISHFTRSQAAIFAAAETMDRIHIVHCGIDPATLTPVNHQGQAKMLMFVGRVVEQKGLGILFDSLERLASEAPDLQLTVVGDGPDRKKLEQRAKDRGLGDRVHFVGSKSQAEVAELLRTADIFVLPSYAEGVPVVVMEALGTGLPVVASFVGGMAELVDDGATGFLVRPGDPVQLADRIGKLVADPALRTKLGTAGRDKVVAEFDATAEANRLGSLFVNTAQGLPSETRPALAASTGSVPVVEPGGSAD
ncbi:MAG: glycosyltransferase [Acidimicrobiales bacterium]